MDVEKFLVKAEEALRKRNAAGAIALFRQVLVAAPNHGAARAGLLSAFRRKAELKGGSSVLDRAAAKSLRAAVAGLRGARQPGALVKTCETGLEKDPLDASLAASLAAGLHELGRPEEALAVWRYRLELDGDDVQALKEAGKLHYELRQIEQAVTCLEQAHALQPHDPEVEKLRKHLAAEGTLAATRFETAKSSRELVKDKGAVGPAERAQRLHRSKDELSEDIAALQARIEQQPQDRQAVLDLTRALLRAGEPRRAQQALEAALARLGRDDGLADLLGEASLAASEAALQEASERGDEEAVRRLKEEKLRLDLEAAGQRVARSPNDIPARLRLARAAYRAGETDLAIEHFQAIAADPRVEVEARTGLGACFFRKGLLPLARRQFEQALDKAGGLAEDRGKEICYHLALVCEREGDRPGALARYLQVYEVDIHFKDVAQKIQALS